jgi:eukaryotic-like serine/threonine-protein kinase
MTQAAERGDVSVEALLAELADDFMRRLERGERPDAEDYAGRHPELAAVLRQVLPALGVLRPATTGPGVPPEPAAAAFPEGRLGDFLIRREVGRGGMGLVYEAEQLSLGRRVALKVLPFAATLDPRQLQRFQNEAQAAACLHHQHIVPVYAVGSEQGVHYYAMQFIDGRTLADLIGELRQLAGLGADAGRPAPPAAPAAAGGAAGSTAEAAAAGSASATERSARGPAHFRMVARLGVEAAEALEHAHQLGVVHRDVKPANLMVDVRGHLWVTDFGLAYCQGHPGLTLTGDLVGTLRYMSPEQTRGKGEPIDHRTDVYSLGVTLYELLTLQPAFDGQERPEVLSRIAIEEPRTPRRLHKAIPAELETIVLKAMAKVPAERYGTAQELADDLRRFLEDRPIRARRPTLWQRLRKWVRRHQSAVVAAGLALVGGLIVSVGVLAASVVQIREAKDGMGKALEKQTLALEQERQLSYRHGIALADKEWWEGNVGRAEKLLDDCEDGRRGWEWHYLKRRCHTELKAFRLGEGGNYSVKFTQDGRHIAAAGYDNILKVWETATGRPPRTLRGQGRYVYSLAFVPDGTRLGLGWSDGKVSLWDNGSGRETLTLDGPPAAITCLGFSPDGRWMAAASYEKTLRIWNALTGQEVHRLTVDHPARVLEVAFSPDSTRLAAGTWDGLMVWDVKTGRELFKFQGGPEDHVRAVAFSPDNQSLASGGSGRVIRMWDPNDSGGHTTFVLGGHTGQVNCLAYSPDGKRLASGSHDQTVKIWDTTTGQEVQTLRGHNAAVGCVAFSPDGRRLTSSGGGTVKVWEATAGQESRALCQHDGAIREAAFSPDGRRLAGAVDPQGVKVWDAATGSILLELTGHTDKVLSVAFSPDSERLISGSWDGTVKVWDALSGREIVTCRGHKGTVGGVAFSPDNRHIVSASKDNTVRIWEATSGRQVCVLQGHSAAVWKVHFSLDGRWLASASADQTVKVWDVRTGQEALTLAGHSGDVRGVAFSPDGTRLASASADASVKLWDVTAGRELFTLAAHTRGAYAVAFSRDGSRLASGGADGVVKVWDVTTGRELLGLSRHQNQITSLAFSPGGRWLAEAGTDGAVRVWDGTPWEDPSADGLTESQR